MTGPTPAPTADLPPEPGPHGDDAGRVAAALGLERRDLLDLSVSLNPFAPDPTAVLAHHLDAVRTYPDPGPATQALAHALGVDPDRVLVTNGGAEAIALVAAARPVGWVDPPDFGLYARHLAELRPDGPRWRSNPHNPSGRLAGPDERAAVWDEAFYPLATGHWTRGDADRGAWVVGSLTKLLACPGLRVGYVLGPDAASVAELADRQPRWSVNGLATAALADLLAPVDLAGWAAQVADARARLVAVLTEVGLAAEPSQANWVLVHAPGLRRALIGQRVLVRDAASFGLDGWVRLAVPHPRHLDRLKSALVAVEAGSPSRLGSRPNPPPPALAPPSLTPQKDAL